MTFVILGSRSETGTQGIVERSLWPLGPGRAPHVQDDGN
jgi:hypothetical protein